MHVIKIIIVLALGAVLFLRPFLIGWLEVYLTSVLWSEAFYIVLLKGIFYAMAWAFFSNTQLLWFVFRIDLIASVAAFLLYVFLTNIFPDIDGLPLTFLLNIAEYSVVAILLLLYFNFRSSNE